MITYEGDILVKSSHRQVTVSEDVDFCKVNESTARRYTIPRLLEKLAAKRVEDYVYPTSPCCQAYILSEGIVSAEKDVRVWEAIQIFDKLPVGLIVDGSENLSTSEFGKLDGRLAIASCSLVDKD